MAILLTYGAWRDTQLRLQNRRIGIEVFNAD